MSIVATAHEVSKRYGGVTALCDVNLRVTEGAIYGVIGVNGAGKTTLLRLLQGRETSDRGRVELLGCEARRLGAGERAQLGVQLERGGLPPYLKAIEVLEWLRSLYPRGASPARLLEALGLEGCAERLVRELSTGQHRRLAVAAALVGDPRVAFFDEPSLGLDPVARRLLWQVMRSAAARGATLIFSTNSMEEAESLCTRVAVLQQGRLLLEGTPRALVERMGSAHRIEFEDCVEARWVPTLSECPGVLRVLHENATHTLVSQDPLSTIGALAELGDAGLPRFRWVPPRLEDAFHRLEEGGSCPEC